MVKNGERFLWWMGFSKVKISSFFTIATHSLPQSYIIQENSLKQVFDYEGFWPHPFYLRHT